MNSTTISLKGLWKIIRDPENRGRENGWMYQIPEGDVREIEIAGTLRQNERYALYTYSKVFPGYHGMVWYYTALEAPEKKEDHRCLIEFDNAGYLCRVWLNGQYLGEHRQHEQKFSMDGTEAVHWNGENLLAVQCFEPKIRGEEIEGIALAEIPNGSQAYGDYDNEPTGGIMGEVRVRMVPNVHIEDIYVRPQVKSGDVELQVTVKNSGLQTGQFDISATVFEYKHGNPVTEVKIPVTAEPGESTHMIKMHVKNHKLWDIDCPALYEVIRAAVRILIFLYFLL